MPDVQKILEALSSPVRREILWLVWNEELTAGAIASAFELRAPTISSHLNVLREAGLVTVTRDRNFRRYRAVHDVLRTVGPGFIPGTPKWNRAHSSAIPQVASSTVCRAVRVSADVPVKPVTAFRAFTDPVIYSAWLGSKVTLDGTHFTCMLPWGRTVRGFYDATVATSLIAMRWDFETDAVPVPGHELTAYLRFDRWGRGTRIEVQQLIGSDDHAVFMERVWTWVLGSYATNHRRRPRRS